MEDSELSMSARLIALTHQMLASAQAGDWERLVNLERARLPLVSEVFSNGVAGKEDLAREILSTDKKTMALAKSGMSNLGQEILSRRNSSKANDAYQSIQGFTSVED